ncbi:MAG: methyltransferase domain-containing protein [Dehalococcoidia bacterium]|nr:methyltransferase domain-containing protein [Dehalococcoidia bacterium]
MTDDQAVWTEADSATFLNLADIAVPSRQEQMDLILSLIPARPDEAFATADIACGEGLLAERLLERFPAARLVAFDGSPLMRERASTRLRRCGARARVLPFDLGDFAWTDQLPSPLRCAVSSLAIHHLDDDGKRRLFRELAGRLQPGGALLIADVIAPGSDAVRRSISGAWHAITRQQSLAATGSLDAYEQAVAEGWAPPTSAEAIPGEMPSGLLDQLKWLEAAGFSQVDCFWLRAGIAIYGGYRPGELVNIVVK